VVVCSPPVAAIGLPGGSAFDKRPTRCNLFAHLLYSRNRGPDETYLSTKCSATQAKARLSLPDAHSCRTRRVEAASCQGAPAYLGLAVAVSRLFVVAQRFGEPFGREVAVVRAAW
jgi:hypothetical protein